MTKKYMAAGGLVALVLVSWLVFGSETEENISIMVSPQRGVFNVNVITTGELQAQSSTSIRGPQGMREFRIYEVIIQELVPEGTVVQKGDFVAELDRSQVQTALQESVLELEEEESAYELAKLDSAATLSEARNNIINLEFALEEQELNVEQSIYESPAVQRQIQNDYEQAKRELEQARKSYVMEQKRAEAELRETLSDLEEERREVRRIREMMEKFTIYAPKNGMVIYKRDRRTGAKLTEGGTISAWEPIVAELPDFSVMESITYVNEVDIQSVQIGQKVDIGLDAMPEKILTGIVMDVANIGEQRPNSSSKVFEVVIEINESDSTLRPAMTTKNTIHIHTLDDELFVPLETIQSQDSLSFVFKREGLETVMQQVKLGLMNENQIVVQQGLSVDDQVYMSIPPDTAGIRKVLLDEAITSN